MLVTDIAWQTNMLASEVLHSGFMPYASGSTLSSATAWGFQFLPLVMVG
jgi:hypothetical protein